MQTKRTVLALTLASVFMASRAAAQDDAPAGTGASPASMQDKLVVKALLGLGGDVEVSSSSDDLEASIGSGVHYEHPLAAWFVLGGYLSLQSWVSETAGDFGYGRNTLIDLSVLPKARYAVNESVELYVASMLGVTFDLLDDTAFGGETDLGLGWNWSALFGGQLAFTDAFGLMGEMGYSLHGFSHTVTPVVGPEVDTDVSMQQFNVTLGLYAKL